MGDVLITFSILGTEKLWRLCALVGKVCLSVVADSTAIIDGLAGAAVSPRRGTGGLYRPRTGTNIWRADDISACRSGNGGSILAGRGQDPDRSVRAGRSGDLEWWIAGHVAGAGRACCNRIPV